MNDEEGTLLSSTLHIRKRKFPWFIICRRVEDVQGVLTLVRRGAAQVCHVRRVEELREQREVEEEDGDRQEEEEEVESGWR